MFRVVTLKDLQEVAVKRGGVLLSSVYLGGQTKLTWQCGVGHVWEARPCDIKNSKSWCARCAGKVKYTLEDVRAMAEARGGTCLSSEYVSRTSKLEWQCAKGHVWVTSTSVIQRGHWCPFCAGQGKLSIADMRQLAATKGGKCLSPTYISCQKPLRWKCRKGHEWSAVPLNVKYGSWCPTCQENRAENNCRRIFEEVSGTSFPKTRPLWLVNSRGNRMELDGYSVDLSLAFEYQGEQHYVREVLRKPGSKRPNLTESQFAWQQQRDQEKRDLCKANGVTLIEVPWDVKDKAAFIREQLTTFLAKRAS